MIAETIFLMEIPHVIRMQKFRDHGFAPRFPPTPETPAQSAQCLAASMIT
jgi:hypothetical protein